MDNSIGSTIEQIKLQEHCNEAKLREKRALEETLASMNRKVREAVTCVAKFEVECVEATTRADALVAGLRTEQAHRCALAAQLEASAKQLQQLKVESEQGVSNVWKLRHLLCNEVQKVSDQCDVWALFTKPKCIELASTPTLKKCTTENTKLVCQRKGILASAQRKRQSILTERDRLLNEPDYGEEFVRIKNALRYSMEMAEQVMKVESNQSCLEIQN